MPIWRGPFVDHSSIPISPYTVYTGFIHCILLWFLDILLLVLLDLLMVFQASPGIPSQSHEGCSIADAQVLPAARAKGVLRVLRAADAADLHHHHKICSYGGWKKSCTTLDDWNPINNGINHLSTGAGFLPSTVWCLRRSASKCTWTSTSVWNLDSPKLRWLMSQRPSSQPSVTPACFSTVERSLLLQYRRVQIWHQACSGLVPRLPAV